MPLSTAVVILFIKDVSDGLVPIELLTINTKVIAFDELRQAMLYKTIIALLLNKTVRLVNIATDRETIYLTMHHRFWVENKKNGLLQRN
ncbi:hypothetical protein NIES2101_01145 [Calothrix sp. HK-06]|nr:hypothetical protein NIES2101_01145 [Calothrix sp. HK-06]